jgi:ribose 5-phosphate isomerase B
MRIHIGSDHAGLELKAALVEYLQGKGHDVTDHGPHEYDAVDDYPDFCIPAAIATLARDHNNANVVGIGGRMHSIDECKAIIDAFVETPFSNDERHVRRINKIAKYENEGSL